MTTIFIYGFIVGSCFGFAVMEILNVITSKEEDPKEDPKEEFKVKVYREELVHFKASSMVAKEMYRNYPEAAADCIIGKISSQLKPIIKDHVRIKEVPEMGAVSGEVDIWVSSGAAGDLNKLLREAFDGKDLR